VKKNACFSIIRESQSRYNLTWGCCRAIIVAVKKRNNIRYSDYVFVAVVSQHAMRMRYVVIRGLPDSTKFVCFINGMIFEKKKNVIEHKIYVSNFSITFGPTISHSQKN